MLKVNIGIYTDKFFYLDFGQVDEKVLDTNCISIAKSEIMQNKWPSMLNQPLNNFYSVNSFFSDHDLHFFLLLIINILLRIHWKKKFQIHFS